MHGHDKERLLISVLIGTTIYVILFLFLNPLDWLEKRRFLEPIGPLVVEFETFPESEEDPVVQDEPETPEEEVPETPVEPEPVPDVQPARQDPVPATTPARTASAAAPTYRLAPNLEDTGSLVGPSLRADEGDPVAAVSETGTESLRVPKPGDQQGESGVIYADVGETPDTDTQPVRPAAPETPRVLGAAQQAEIRESAAAAASSSTNTQTRTQDTQQAPRQSVFESLEELTQNRQPNGELARPQIPESLKRAGQTKYEVIVSFVLTDGGAVTNVTFEKPPENQELAVNIISTLRRWTFVPAAESVTVRLRYVVEVR